MEFTLSVYSFVCDTRLQQNVVLLVLQIEEALLHRRKLELIQKYASDNLQEEEMEAKEMVGI